MHASVSCPQLRNRRSPPASTTGNLVGNTLTLSGSDTIANYQTALRSVTYANTSDSPSGGGEGLMEVAEQFIFGWKDQPCGNVAGHLHAGGGIT